MDDVFLEKSLTKVLDFATDKRKEWETRHLLYSVIFELTPRCNFKCVHCYLANHHESEELSFEKVIEIIDILYEKEVLFLTFTGGDIFMRKDFCDIYVYAKKKGFIVELYTNGVLINDSIVDLFVQYPPLLVDISLYGANDESYFKVTGQRSYNKVVSNVKKLKNAGIRVSLKAPVLKQYFDELPLMKNLADNLELPFRTGFEIFPTIDNDSSVQKYAVPMEDSLKYEFQEFDKRPRTFGEDYEVELVDLQKSRPLFRCKLGRSSCVIDYKGRMCPCMSFRHAGVHLTKDNFDEIWNSFSKYPSMKASEKYPCLKCKAYDFCDICPAMMEFVHGDLEYVDKHFCRSAWARYSHYMKGIPSDVILSKNY